MYMLKFYIVYLSYTMSKTGPILRKKYKIKMKLDERPYVAHDT